MSLLPLAAVSIPALTALAAFSIGERSDAGRNAANLLGSLATSAVVAILLAVVSRDAVPSWSIPFVPGAPLALQADRTGLTFGAVAAGLWFVTVVYAVGYMSNGRDRGRFFGFFALCISAAIGISLSANLLTFFLFYEVLTLATWPLVTHSGTPAAIRAGRVYIAYAIGAGTALLAGVVWLYALAGEVPFTPGGSLSGIDAPGQLIAIFALLSIGLAVKTALVPLHGWLPQAMVAPAPVSALLHAVAVVKAGAFGFVRLGLDVYGPETMSDLGVHVPLATVAALTIVYASVRALGQDDLKRRLAYSTVGQLSYIVLGVALLGAATSAAALAHLAHHALMKITLFFGAGALAETLGVYRVSEMDGVGRRMPLTMGAFTLAALGIAGVPPVAGFVTKYELGSGAVAVGRGWGAALMLLSGLLAAAYLLPIIGRAWFRESQPDLRRRAGLEGDWRLVLPPLLTAVAALAAGALAGAPFSPMTWARAAVAAAFGRLL